MLTLFLGFQAVAVLIHVCFLPVVGQNDPGEGIMMILTILNFFVYIAFTFLEKFIFFEFILS